MNNKGNRSINNDHKKLPETTKTRIKIIEGYALPGKKIHYFVSSA